MMRLSFLSVVGFMLNLVSSSTCSSNATTNATANAHIGNAVEIYETSSSLRLDVNALLTKIDGKERCTANNVRTRKSWDALTTRERSDYIAAVKCLRQSKARVPKSFAPGAFNRIDDFTVTHVNQTLFIHFSGWLLPWHRYFVWQYETALREECGYDGTQPYWDWPQHSEDYSKDPLFDGSEHSLGGNGAYVPHGLFNGTVPGVPAPQVITRPPGTGGGCVIDGPFANTTLTLGPVFPDPQNLHLRGFENNPHCLTRDFFQPLAQQFLTNASVSTLLAQPALGDFRRQLDASVHFAGHSYVGGDMSDIFTGPADPVFFFHHAQLDRLWTIWQEQDFLRRVPATSDTVTYANSPPSANATLHDTLDFGYVGGQIIMSEVVDSLNGLMCVKYE